MIDIGCEHPSWAGSLALAKAEPDLLSSLGIHPHEASTWNADVRAELAALVSAEERIVAVGEMGLDYYYDHSPREQQRRAFHEQLALAGELGYPAILHVRDAHDEAAAILAEHDDVRGIVHCFTGDAAAAERYLELGYVISFSGIVTFKKATDIQAAAAMVPLDQMLVETDSPYLAPVPKRGRRNEPGYVAHTGAYIAAMRGVELAEFAALTLANTARVMRFPEELK